MDDALSPEMAAYGRLTENFIGLTSFPLYWLPEPKIIGNNGLKQSSQIPWAGMVNNYLHIGFKGIAFCNRAGGTSSICTGHEVQRCPAFRFDCIENALSFANVVGSYLPRLQQICKQQSRNLQLINVQAVQEGNLVNLILGFDTADAAGQNMVTLATDLIGRFLADEFSNTLENWYIESNLAGDKKASPLRFTRTRGWKIIASVHLPEGELNNLGIKTDDLLKTWQSNTMQRIAGVNLGNVGNMAGFLAPYLLATGQDVACLAESSMGLLRLERTETGFNIFLTLPGLMLGTVGGGTASPSAQKVLQKMDCLGSGKAQKFAEITGAWLLAALVGQMLEPQLT